MFISLFLNALSISKTPINIYISIITIINLTLSLMIFYMSFPLLSTEQRGGLREMLQALTFITLIETA